ncbi:hypothetical protein [Streptomyces althioticus]
MLTFAQAAAQLVEDGIVPNMTAEGLRRLARDPSSGWPIGPDDYGEVAGARLLPYELLAPFMKERAAKRRGRGPDKKPRGETD